MLASDHAAITVCLECQIQEIARLRCVRSLAGFKFSSPDIERQSTDLHIPLLRKLIAGNVKICQTGGCETGWRIAKLTEYINSEF
jgi:hypothetical protein